MKLTWSLSNWQLKSVYYITICARAKCASDESTIACVVIVFFAVAPVVKFNILEKQTWRWRFLQLSRCWSGMSSSSCYFIPLYTCLHECGCVRECVHTINVSAASNQLIQQCEDWRSFDSSWSSEVCIFTPTCEGRLFFTSISLFLVALYALFQRLNKNSCVS